MISFTESQLNTWLIMFMFPLARILGLLITSPVFNSNGLPIRMRVAIGVAITVAIAPTLTPSTQVAAASWMGLLQLTQETLIGMALGFIMRIVFAAVDLAGELIGVQMGLGFALFFDPQNATQVPIMSEFLGTLTLLIFLAADGHLMMLSILTESFQWIPPGTGFLKLKSLESAVRWAATVFSAGVLLSLPVIAALLLINIGLGVLTRAAPTLNLFAVGFPLTLLAGFAGVAALMTYLAPLLLNFFEQGLSAVSLLAKPVR